MEAAAEHTEVSGCVVGIDLLDRPGTEAALQIISKHRIVRGVRIIAPENHGVGILSDRRANETVRSLGVAGLSLDLLIRCSNPGQLEEVVKFVQIASDTSETVIIGDHLLKPTRVHLGQPTGE